MDVLKKGLKTNEKRYRISQHQLYLVLPDVWRKLKRANKIDKKYQPVARRIAWISYLTRPLQLLQNSLNRRVLREISFEDKPPLFILGHWRSGTTFLHYTLSKDKQFGYLCNYQNYAFNIALLSRKGLRAISRLWFPEKRPQDNIKMSPYYPAEEEQPFTTISTRSGMHTFFFPRNRMYFDKYNLFKGINAREKRLWQRDYMWLLRNISLYMENKPLLLKNPHNTGRVRELLELFPNAKFIFLHRDPYTTFLSTLHLWNTVIRTQFFQEVGDQEIREMAIYMFRETLRKYLDERELIPKGNLVEVPYAELDADPGETVKMIYEKLGIPGYAKAEPDIRKHLEKVKDYKKNVFRELPEEQKARIYREMKFYFDAFGYEQ
ncbi:MAG: sulfotransferase [Candidatus Neomarinimicrobiota bacterium]|jgi:hypothetical protein|nr:sulfotransferase [Candidatus Neomarinimicrobiota bacterium]MDD3966023.1 sulfotransferase [Candidatus Neomarinimicrobiota bacterium]MDX9780007.1 sulfotransferase [bacterium]